MADRWVKCYSCGHRCVADPSLDLFTVIQCPKCGGICHDGLTIREWAKVSARREGPVVKAEIEIDKTASAVVLLVVGAIICVCGLAGYIILFQVRWAGWQGVVAAAAIFLCGLAMLGTGWNAWKVLRE